MLSVERNVSMRGVDVVTESDRREAALWRRLKQDDDAECRQAIFDDYRSYAISLSRREYRRRPPYGLELTDFEQLAHCGLLQAIDRYDPVSGCSFKTFARYRILGSIADGSSRSSEEASAYTAARRAERDRLRSLSRSDSGLHPTDSIDALRELVANLAVSVLVESVTRDRLESVPDATRTDAYESLRFNQIRRGLLEQVENLPERQRDVVKRHYFDDMPFNLIADLLGVSKGRISQLHSAAIKRLRRMIPKR